MKGIDAMKTYADVRAEIRAGADALSVFAAEGIDPETALEMMDDIIKLDAQEVAAREQDRDCRAFVDSANAAGLTLIPYAPPDMWRFPTEWARTDDQTLLACVIALRPHLPSGYRLDVYLSVSRESVDVHIWRHNPDD